MYTERQASYFTKLSRDYFRMFNELIDIRDKELTKVTDEAVEQTIETALKGETVQGMSAKIGNMYAACQNIKRELDNAKKDMEYTEVKVALTAAKPTQEALEEGMYKFNDVIYKVQLSRYGSGHFYAKKLVQHGDKWSFEYAQGDIRFIRPEHRMTLEEAKKFGQVTGTCCVCGRVLNNEASIAAGIGPICAQKF